MTDTHGLGGLTDRRTSGDRGEERGLLVDSDASGAAGAGGAPFGQLLRRRLLRRALAPAPVAGSCWLTPGIRVCVHPWRVRLPVGAYASEGIPVPEVAPVEDEVATTPPVYALRPPTEIEDLHAWLTATLRLAGPRGLDAALDEAQTIALDLFPQDTVLGALRDVLGRELARPNRPRPAPRSRTSRPRPAGR